MADELARELEQLRARERDGQALIAQLEERLLEAETRLARVGELELELRETTLALEHLRHERDEARALLERAQRVHDDMVGSLSWRLTRPLRALKR